MHIIDAVQIYMNLAIFKIKLESRDTQVNRYKVMQYFYIVVYTIVGDDLTMCKIGLNPQQLTKWGRKEATKHPERSYKLYRQSITHTGKITFYKQLKSYATEVEHSLKVAKEGFDWDAFEANRGSDMDIDIRR